jgi:putative peptidoglycan lipid II flippase
MSLGTVISRVTGVLKLAAIAAALGVVESGKLADTYNLANTAPNIIYELILGGVLTSVFVPVFVELLDKEGRERAWQVASAMLNLTVLVLTTITIIGIVAAPWIAKLYAAQLEGPQQQLQEEALTFLLRLFVPQIVFYGLAAATAGLLNANKRFGAPMYTPILNNLAVITVFLVFRQVYGKVNGLGDVTTSQLTLMGIGTTAGVALMAVAQLPFLRGLGRYSWTLSIRHPAIKQLARLSVFVIGYVVANQIGYLIVQVLANQQQGGYTAYISAFTFFMLPHGLFAVSVITALLPGMSQHAVDRDWDRFRALLSTGVRGTFLLVLPAAVGYLILGEAIVRLMLEHGVMSPESTDLVADVLRLFVLGLVPFSIFQLFLRAFYAMQDTKTPFLINCATVALNTAINVALFKSLRVQGLAAGHAIAYVFAVIVQGRVLSRRIGGLDGARMLRSGLRIGAAAAAMGVAVWATSRGLEAVVSTDALTGQILAVAVPIALGVGAYLGFCLLFGVEELTHVRTLVTRRLGRDTHTPDDGGR